MKIYIVATATSTREVAARSKREAIEIFKNSIKGYWHGEKITVK